MNGFPLDIVRILSNVTKMPQKYVCERGTFRSRLSRCVRRNLAPIFCLSINSLPIFFYRQNNLKFDIIISAYGN